MNSSRERFRILAAVLTLMVAIAGWLSFYDERVRAKFMDLALLYTGSMFALMTPRNNDQPPTGSE
jgi:hypothetical protein